MDKTQLPELLVKISESFGPPDNILIYSLASSLSPFERFPTTTATVAFKRTPSIFDDGRIEWTFLAKHTSLQQNIVVDVHFWGFTALNDVDPDLHTIEYVIIMLETYRDLLLIFEQVVLLFVDLEATRLTHGSEKIRSQISCGSGMDFLLTCNGYELLSTVTILELP